MKIGKLKKKKKKKNKKKKIQISEALETEIKKRRHWPLHQDKMKSKGKNQSPKAQLPTLQA